MTATHASASVPSIAYLMATPAERRKLDRRAAMLRRAAEQGVEVETRVPAEEVRTTDRTVAKYDAARRVESVELLDNVVRITRAGFGPTDYRYGDLVTVLRVPTV
jgi:hypothetical protein